MLVRFPLKIMLVKYISYHISINKNHCVSEIQLTVNDPLMLVRFHIFSINKNHCVCETQLTVNDPLMLVNFISSPSIKIIV